MLRPRIIPCLLVHDGGLVKTIQFKEHKYVGDPINAVKIFNEKEADELIVLDIDATVQNAEPNYQMIAHLAAECRMPLCYGGGIKTAEQADRIISMGVEKVAVSAGALDRPKLIEEIASRVGNQSVAVVIDYRKKVGLLKKGVEVTSRNATVVHDVGLIDFAKQMQDAGAGEIILNSVDLDGKMSGYDIATAELLRLSVSVPITILGGAGKYQDIADLIARCGVLGAAAGSLFVFKGPYRAVLINYPTVEQKDAIIESAQF